MTKTHKYGLIIKGLEHDKIQELDKTGSPGKGDMTSLSSKTKNGVTVYVGSATPMDMHLFMATCLEKGASAATATRLE